MRFRLPCGLREDGRMDDEVRWLGDEEQRVWRAFLAATGMLNGHLEQRLQSGAGIPHAYYAVLVELSEAPDRTLRMSELAARSRFSRSRLSHAVARMESKGWVRRDTCLTDKRGAQAILTEAGLAVLKEAAPGHVRAVREALFDVLTPAQVHQLGQISTAIVDALAPRCEAALAEDFDAMPVAVGEQPAGRAS